MQQATADNCAENSIRSIPSNGVDNGISLVVVSPFRHDSGGQIQPCDCSDHPAYEHGPRFRRPGDESGWRKSECKCDDVTFVAHGGSKRVNGMNLRISPGLFEFDPNFTLSQQRLTVASASCAFVSSCASSSRPPLSKDTADPVSVQSTLKSIVSALAKVLRANSCGCIGVFATAQ